MQLYCYALLIHRIRNARPLHRSSFPPGEEKQNNIKYYNKITNHHQQWWLYGKGEGNKLATPSIGLCKCISNGHQITQH